MIRNHDKMRIAWVCPYPASVGNFCQGSRPKSITHPIPWITLQAPLVAAIPNIELHILTIGKGYKEDYHFIDRGIHFHFLKVPNFPRTLLLYQWDRYRIHQCLQNTKPDLVHAFGTEEGYSYAAVTSGYPTVIMIQGIISRIVSGLGGLWAILRTPRWVVPILLEKYTINRCQTFIAETRFAAGFVREINPAATIYFVKTPVRREFFHVQRNPVPADKPEILFVGSVIREKGIEVLLQGVARIVQEFARFKLHVAGPYSPQYMNSSLEPLMSRLGISDQVRFHGLLSASEIAELMSKVTLLVLPTYMDTSPNVVAESQVAGVPVVASSVGGIPEMIEHGATGFLVEPGSVEALAHGLLQILRHPGLAKDMAGKARAQAWLDYQPENQVQKLAAIYYHCCPAR